MQRKSGILLHPTSFPSRYGIGDLGTSAYRFIDFLKAAEQSHWQILPLGPTSYGNSPYQCTSSFAGNPLLISPEQLSKQKYLTKEQLESAPKFPDEAVDFPAVSSWKMSILKAAYQGFRSIADDAEWRCFEEFCLQHQSWLNDFACFVAIKEAQEEQPWNEWPSALALRDSKALSGWQSKNDDSIQYHRFVQYQYHLQWQKLKQYAHQHGIRIIGDVPIFVAYDSAEVWSNPDLFELDEMKNPTVVAGVPPDYFSETGQLWGNPLYRWSKMKEDGYQWWQNRLKILLESVDMIRIDHFRGFEKYWEIPAGQPTAIHGQWVEGPQMDFFQTLKNALGELPLIAEDLGMITPEVENLRDSFGFPGMKVLQFAFFEGTDNPYLPHHYQKNSVVYTGTHDNNTTRGWFAEISDGDRKRVQEYLGVPLTSENVAPALIRLAWASTAQLAIAPLQDLFNLGEEARMNVPGTVGENWKWRYRDEMLTDQIASQLKKISKIFQRS
ncbi:MAG: 4-alpha-glucanotransferase [SAR324 cluster bacterium]|nr:4-alpha-glucanotransferase [SAR324 cluster bacterium]